MNILGKNELKKYLEVFILLALAIYRQKWTRLSQFNISMLYNKMFTTFFNVRLKRLIFDQLLIKTNGF